MTPQPLTKERLAEINIANKERIEVAALKGTRCQISLDVQEMLNNVAAQDELIEKLGGAVDGWMNRDRTQVNKDFDGVDKILKSLEAYRAWKENR